MFQRLKDLDNRVVVVILVLIAVASFAPSLVIELNKPTPSIQDWFAALSLNFGTEMLGAALTFLLLYLWVEKRDRQLEQEAEDKKLKSRLLRQMSSRDNDAALNALGELSLRDWHRDGTLDRAQLAKANLLGADFSHARLKRTHFSGATLSKANFTGSDLSQAYMDWADLTGAKFTGARLHEASLWKANLSGAINLNATQLASVRLLRGAHLPDGRIYDGRYNLEGDIQKARAEKVDVDDPPAMAQWYGVSVEEYQQGQALAKQSNRP